MINALKNYWKPRKPSDERGPLKTMFILTSMPVGGAETLLVDLIRRMESHRFTPEIACLKNLDELGEVMSREVTTTSNFLTSKYDLRVLPKLTSYLIRNKIDAVITVGAGDKMFWGRLAAFIARTPVVASALHSTGWPDGVSTLNQMLTPITDTFIAVAEEHGRFLREEGGFPDKKVSVIPNGVDTHKFRRDIAAGSGVREEYGIPLDAPVCGILAALRPEKNHDMFLNGAQRIRQRFPDAQFLVVGDGEERARLEAFSRTLGIDDAVHFLGTRSDVPSVLAAMNCMLLTSKMEANPVSILEALATEVPVVATRVGSVPTTVSDNQTGLLVEPDNVEELVEKVSTLLNDLDMASQLGRNGRELVDSQWSVDAMVCGYQDLITRIYDEKARPSDSNEPAPKKTNRQKKSDTEDFVRV